MFKSKEFDKIYCQIRLFNDLLENYSMNTKDSNDDSTISILYSYEKNIKNNFKQLFECVNDKKESKYCLQSFSENFIQLRSDISLQIEKLNKNKV